MPVTDWRGAAVLQERCFIDELGMLSFESQPWAGGVMGRTLAGMWCNSSAAPFGWGDGVVSSGELAELRGFFEPLGIEPRISLTTYAPDETFRVIATAGFRAAQFGTVFAASPGDIVRAPTPEGVKIERLDPAAPSAVEEAAWGTHLGFAGEEPNEHHMRLGRAPIQSGRVATLIARVGGELAGVAGINLFEDLGYLAFATTLEPFRGRGIHSALIGARVAIAEGAGCRWITVAGRPGAGTERNAARLGFIPAYTRISFTRPGEGLQANA